MRIPCFLAQIRHDAGLSLADVNLECGIDRGTLSQIENGRRLPKDADRPAMEAAYGAPAHLWYPADVLLLIQLDREAEHLG